MAVMDDFCSFGFLVRVQSENDFDGLLPIGPFLVRIEQP